MTLKYHNFISSILGENYAAANKYLEQLVEAKLKAKIKTAINNKVKKVKAVK